MTQVSEDLPVAATGACAAPGGARTGRREVLLARGQGVSNDGSEDGSNSKPKEEHKDV